MPFKGKSLPLFFFADCRNIPAQSTIKHCAVMEFQMIEQSAFDEMKTLVTLQYYRSEGIIPSTSLGNKILYKESDIARILQNNLIAPSK